MSPLTTAVAAIAFLFAALLAFKTATKLRFCVVCASVSLTWIALLAAWRLGASVDRSVVALLMGQSVVGAYYLAEKRLPDRYGVFRLPFLLTLTAAAGAALGLLRDAAVPALLAGLWAAFGGVYAYRNAPRVKATADRIIACCKDW